MTQDVLAGAHEDEEDVPGEKPGPRYGDWDGRKSVKAKNDAPDKLSDRRRVRTEARPKRPFASRANACSDPATRPAARLAEGVACRWPVPAGMKCSNELMAREHVHWARYAAAVG